MISTGITASFFEPTLAIERVQNTSYASQAEVSSNFLNSFKKILEALTEGLSLATVMGALDSGPKSKSSMRSGEFACRRLRRRPQCLTLRVQLVDCARHFHRDCLGTFVVRNRNPYICQCIDATTRGIECLRRFAEARQRARFTAGLNSRPTQFKRCI